MTIALATLRISFGDKARGAYQYDDVAVVTRCAFSFLDKAGGQVTPKSEPPDVII
jgi:hypothetical protein